MTYGKTLEEIKKGVLATQQGKVQDDSNKVTMVTSYTKKPKAKKKKRVVKKSKKKS